MFIDLCEINDKYRGADRDINPKSFSLNNNYKLDFKMYCDFCNYELEFNGEEKILSDRLNMLEKLRKKIIILNWFFLIENQLKIFLIWNF